MAGLFIKLIVDYLYQYADMAGQCPHHHAKVDNMKKEHKLAHLISVLTHSR